MLVVGSVAAEMGMDRAFRDTDRMPISDVSGRQVADIDFAMSTGIKFDVVFVIWILTAVAINDIRKRRLRRRRCIDDDRRLLRRRRLSGGWRIRCDRWICADWRIRDIRNVGYDI